MAEIGITTCLWFDAADLDAAVAFYTGLFDVADFEDMGFGPDGSVTVATWEMLGSRFRAAAGDGSRTNGDIVLRIECRHQEDFDQYWYPLAAEGEELPQGRVRDRFGLMWEFATPRFGELFGEMLQVAERTDDYSGVTELFDAFHRMRRIVIAELEAVAARYRDGGAKRRAGEEPVFDWAASEPEPDPWASSEPAFDPWASSETIVDPWAAPEPAFDPWASSETIVDPWAAPGPEPDAASAKCDVSVRRSDHVLARRCSRLGLGRRQA